MVLRRPSTVTTSLPWARSALNWMKGYLRDEGRMSSSVILSSSFFRDDACLDFEALALNRAMNAFSSSICSSFFAFEADRCPSAIWLVSYQKV